MEGRTVQFTRPGAPPPLTDPLHWVTVASVVLCTGLHARGMLPPPAPVAQHLQPPGRATEAAGRRPVLAELVHHDELGYEHSGET